jgi:hypothetical protein
MLFVSSSVGEPVLVADLTDEPHAAGLQEIHHGRDDLSIRGAGRAELANERRSAPRSIATETVGRVLVSCPAYWSRARDR